MRSLLEQMQERGGGTVPEHLAPYTAPLTMSIAAPMGAFLPSRSGARHVSEEYLDGQDNPVEEWTPWGIKSVDAHGYRLSSGPQAGEESRPAQGTGYVQNEALWNLSGVATGWSRPYAPTPGHSPTPKMAIGRWTPFGGGAAPLPGNPTPAAMLTPRL